MCQQECLVLKEAVEAAQSQNAALNDEIAQLKEDIALLHSSKTQMADELVRRKPKPVCSCPRQIAKQNQEAFELMRQASVQREVCHCAN